MAVVCKINDFNTKSDFIPLQKNMIFRCGKVFEFVFLNTD